ncbi:MAG: Tad domain-containing protein [Anaerolineales bacterium]
MLHNKSEKGQALVLIALAVVGLVGFTALAIDGGRVFSDRRHAQSAADTAALTAALAKIKKQNITTAAQNIAASNGYVDAAANQDVTVHSPPISGIYLGNPDYIQVIIRSTIPTTFARVIGRKDVTSIVEAVAMASTSTSGTSGGFGITALKQTCAGLNQETLKFTGSGPVNIQGGIGSNSCFSVTGSADFNVTGNVLVGGSLSQASSGNWTVSGNIWSNGFSHSGSGSWNIAGGFFSNAGFSHTGSGNFTAASLTAVPPTTDNGSGTVSPAPAVGAPQTTAVITDPFVSDLTPPALPPGTCVAANFTGATDNTINPGCYTSITNSASGDLTLNPGIYYIIGGVNTSGSGSLTANGVMLYLQTGSFNMGGSGVLTISPMTTGPYQGLSIYMDRNNTGSYSMNGSGGSSFTGTIYAPSSTVTVRGSGGTFVVDSRIICSTAEFTGAGNLNLIFNPANNYNPSAPEIELSQ